MKIITVARADKSYSSYRAQTLEVGTNDSVASATGRYLRSLGNYHGIVYLTNLKANDLQELREFALTQNEKEVLVGVQLSPLFPVASLGARGIIPSCPLLRIEHATCPTSMLVGVFPNDPKAMTSTLMLCLGTVSKSGSALIDTIDMLEQSASWPWPPGSLTVQVGEKCDRRLMALVRILHKNRRIKHMIFNEGSGPGFGPNTNPACEIPLDTKAINWVSVAGEKNSTWVQPSDEAAKMRAILDEVHNWALLSTMGHSAADLMSNIGRIVKITDPEYGKPKFQVNYQNAESDACAQVISAQLEKLNNLGHCPWISRQDWPSTPPAPIRTNQ